MTWWRNKLCRYALSSFVRVIIAVVCVPIGEGAVLKLMSQLAAAQVDRRRAAEPEVRLAAEAAAAAEAVATDRGGGG
jgi:hypothetical protein